jgi:hypothetical protein
MCFFLPENIESPRRALIRGNNRFCTYVLVADPAFSISRLRATTCSSRGPYDLQRRDETTHSRFTSTLFLSDEGENTRDWPQIQWRSTNSHAAPMRRGLYGIRMKKNRRRALSSLSRRVSFLTPRCVIAIARVSGSVTRHAVVSSYPSLFGTTSFKLKRSARRLKASGGADP